MNTNLLRRARRYFNSDVLTREQNRNHIRKWIRMIKLLGNKWLALVPQTEESTK